MDSHTAMRINVIFRPLAFFCDRFLTGGHVRTFCANLFGIFVICDFGKSVEIDSIQPILTECISHEQEFPCRRILYIPTMIYRDKSAFSLETL